MCSDRLRVPLRDLGEAWTLDDVFAAHDMLDLIEDQERRAMREAEAKRGHG